MDERIPIIQLYTYLKARQRVCVWLYDRTDLSIEGNLTGFDEFFNLTLEDAVEKAEGAATPTAVGTILLKADCIVLIHPCE